MSAMDEAKEILVVLRETLSDMWVEGPSFTEQTEGKGWVAYGERAIGTGDVRLLAVVKEDSREDLIDIHNFQVLNLCGELRKLRAELQAAQAQVATLEELVRVGAQIRKSGDNQEWTIWSNYADKVRLSTDFYQGVSLPPNEEGFETVLDAVAEVLKRWQAEYKPT